jgi:hypothetical protein
MFNRKLKAKVESVGRRIDYLEDAVRGIWSNSIQHQLWTLQSDFSRLLEHFGLERAETHTVEYRKKGKEA